MDLFSVARSFGMLQPEDDPLSPVGSFHIQRPIPNLQSFPQRLSSTFGTEMSGARQQNHNHHYRSQQPSQFIRRPVDVESPAIAANEMLAGPAQNSARSSRFFDPTSAIQVHHIIAQTESTQYRSYRSRTRRDSPPSLLTETNPAARAFELLLQQLSQPVTASVTLASPAEVLRRMRAEQISSARRNTGSVALQNETVVPMPLFHASVHQSFRSKSVYQINCASCNQVLCQRGMKAILLANINVTLFSTDVLPEGRVELVNDIYPTSQCKCKIREIACLGCGNVVGYHITQPCKNCLSACNNGHVWMFHDQQVQGIHRLVSTNGSKMKWGDLPSAKTDLSYVETIETICR